MSDAPPSSSRRVWRSLLVIAVIVGGLSLYAKLTISDETPDSDSGLQAAENLLAPAAPAIPLDEREDITERLEQPRPNLSVTVVDTEGSRVTDAAILAVGPYERKKEAVGAASWTDMAEGEWTITAEAEGYFPNTEGVNIRRGKDGEVEVVLEKAALIQGVLKTTYGMEGGNARAFFLQPDDEVPDIFEFEPEDIPFTDVLRGEFVSPPLAEGPWRVFVRGAGKLAMESEHVELKLGQRKSVEIVAERRGLIRVVFENLPEIPKGGRSTFALLDKEEREANPRRDGTLRPKRESRWRARNKTTLKGNEPVDLSRVRADTYRVRVAIARGEEYESVNSFEYLGDSAKLLTVRLNDGAFEEETEYKPCTVEISDDPALPLAQQTGFIWLN